MKLSIISAAFPPHQSGEATNAHFLAQQLADRGHVIDVLTTQGNHLPTSDGVNVFPMMNRWDWSEQKKLTDFFLCSRPDAILLMYIGWTYRHEFMITFAPTIAKRACPDTPFVTRFENVMGADYRHTSWWSRIIRKRVALCVGHAHVDYSFGTLFSDSDRLIFLSERHRSQAATHHAPINNKSTLIPPPPNMHVSNRCHLDARRIGRNELAIAQDAIAIGYLGYLYPGKGLEDLLIAFAKLNSKNANTRLVIIGGAIDADAGHSKTYLQTLRQLAGELGIADHIVWTGTYDSNSEQSSHWVNACDLFVLPFSAGVQLNNSSFASVAAHHLPIVTTRGEALEEPFKHLENVCLCDPGSIDQLVRAMQMLVDQPEFKDKLSAGIAKLAGEWFSWDRNLERTLGTFQLPTPLFQQDSYAQVRECEVPS